MSTGEGPAASEAVMDRHGAAAAGGATPDRWQRPVLAAVDLTVDADDAAHAGADGTNGPRRMQVSFDNFYRQEYRHVLGLAYVLTGNASVAEDTAQDAFTAAYRQWAAIGGYD